MFVDIYIFSIIAMIPFLGMWIYLGYLDDISNVILMGIISLVPVINTVVAIVLIGFTIKSLFKGKNE